MKRFLDWATGRPTHVVNGMPLSGGNTYTAPCDCPIRADHHWNAMFPVEDS